MIESIFADVVLLVNMGATALLVGFLIGVTLFVCRES